jgi:uncharacterized membrane protein required for colicin V production
MGMNLLDVGIIILLALITLRGYYRGLFQEVAVLVGIIGGVALAAYFYLRLAVMIHPWINDPDWARWVAFAVIFVAVYWLARLVAHFLQQILYHLYLDFFDRVLGGCFALVKGALLVGFGLMFLGVVLPKSSSLLRTSVSAPRLISFSRQSLTLLPPEFKQRLDRYIHEWRHPREKHQAEGFRLPERDGLPTIPTRPAREWSRA